MISHPHRTLFVHIPKVAGQSIETMFLNAMDLSWEQRATLLLRERKPGEKGPERLAHLTAQEYVDLGYLDEKSFKAYFKFTFVRNPYARVFSTYNFLGFSRLVSFSYFIEKIVPLKLKQHDFFFKPAHEYLLDNNGNLLVDFVGKLEHIKEDIEIVKAKTNLEGASLPHVNKEKGGWKRAIGLLVRNPNMLWHLQLKNASAMEAAYTETTKKKIYQWYQKDFEIFEYQR
ncbi:MAG TPA: sulfotransferase family 2 domain-containing protein [Flavobacteriaceae bacterium]|nr:sulfotransferase family 2 domain-containing protein [Flavobacteriaceae bacterium]MCB9211920.1 sulfotransferase family 2 domain-containing protein [Alteromonas sp.]HPF09986.1 sulfotransferase family 2 domain-containing protein [Flavobacteriaceae bacterium]HQU20083.1 sulfotransferase family 2 domain-containing protein [Flavobacteriaceae bacterium]HQU63931.1 sulfotransferase family 2 domain-containing protein [Flavobacteriaceae bacterium]